MPGEEEDLVGEMADMAQLAKMQAQQQLLLQGIKPGTKKEHLAFNQWEIAYDMWVALELAAHVAFC